MKDTTIAATNVIIQADKLFSEREHFETVTLTRTNEELYGLLSQVYSLYKSAAQNENCLKESVDSMRQKLKERNIVTQANTPCITVFVRYIFNSDRKRSYNYTQTLLAAINQKVEPKHLADFITSNKGVEEIKKTRSVTPKQKEKATQLKAAISAAKDRLSTMAPVKSVRFDSSVELSDATNYVFVIARVKDNGKLELLRPVPKTTVGMENAAIKAIAEESMQQHEDNTFKVTKTRKDLDLNKASESLSLDDSIAA
jgi:hypothetical protein